MVAEHYNVSPKTVTLHADKAAAVMVANQELGIHFSYCSERSGNTAIEIDGRSSIGSVDTVPIRVPATEKCFQPKYQDSVVKFLVAVTHHGYAFYCSGPFAGASHDQVIADRCGFFSQMAEEFPGSSIVADGIFSAQCPNVIITE